MSAPHPHKRHLDEWEGEPGKEAAGGRQKGGRQKGARERLGGRKRERDRGEKERNQLPPKIAPADSKFPDLYIPESNTEKVTVKCTAQNGDITYTWKKDGIKVENSQIVGVDSKTGEISFLKIELGDYGTYQCFASNNYGTALSKPFKVERPTLVSGTFINDDEECQPFGLCTIDCKGDCYPESECAIEWKIGKGTDKAVETSKRVAVGKDGKLYFLWLNATADVTDESGLLKVYGCGVWNEALKSLNKKKETTIKVVNRPNTPDRRPNGIYSSDDKVEKGQDGELTCIFQGRPVPSIEWMKPDRSKISINDNKYSIGDYGRKLIIRDVEEKDEGKYTCIGSNDSGQSGTMTPFLNVTSAPFLRNNEQMTDQIKPAGSNATFSCDAISLQNPPEDPPSPPKWYKNGEDIPADQFGQGKKYSLSNDKKVLTVKDVKKGVDTGNFQCESHNSEGMLFKDAFLKVIEPIVVSSPQESVVDMEISLGDVLNLGVLASTEPSLTLRYVWEYESDSSDPNQPAQPITVDNNLYWTLFNGRRNLSIDTTVFGDEEKRIFEVVGQYRVKVYHEYQSKMVTFNVFTNIVPPVVEPQTPPVIQSANLWYLAVIFGIIVLIIVIILIICMLFRNKGGVYLVDKKEVAAGHDPERELRDSGFHDLSRGDDEDNPKMDQVSLSDDFDKDVGSDDDSMADYDGDLNASKFNEDGSFIGLYGDKKSKTGGTTTV
ncbi:hypothetical protein FSP39_008976 [Pinctada imbricata]|uniref:Ig-like domain-containing protein n=1 Tax=Pinctada imbricata TaxID=66713 RepID=A0AA88XLJ9_PINIB|nr:hypothetical protein FSP39_008976 [Pinctada imbricata]